VLEHKDDCPDAAITGKYILRWTENDDVDSGVKKFRKNKADGVANVFVSASGDTTTKNKPGRKPKSADGSVPPKLPKKPPSGKKHTCVNFLKNLLDFWKYY
jgi:hypothetical protein